MPTMSASAATSPSDVWVRGPVSAPQEPPSSRAPAAPYPQHPSLDEALRQGPLSPDQIPAPAAAPVRPSPPVPVTVPAIPRPRADRDQGGDTASPAPPAVDASWVSAHGGAGATTFAAALGGTDAGQDWPDIAQGQPGRVLLLARTNATGLRAASQALDALRTVRHPSGVDLLALVLVADAPGRLPLELTRRVRVLRSAARTFHIPWIPEWRVGEPAAKVPKAVRELAAILPPVRPTPKDGQ
ncbi:DUF6668 family protein [Streptomyces rishiriensis]|uniref:Uncharacterized protein n=1 Tax=Streptomyces rishiriensis TaxID=68264 RepID=A0ABU0NHU2_STRRH|nr:DUF6668 family protein [Streptomyces rishiriensis]MDQ0578202.1 hypothetical protein [Streptomyces rishiriensis]